MIDRLKNIQVRVQEGSLQRIRDNRYTYLIIAISSQIQTTYDDTTPAGLATIIMI